MKALVVALGAALVAAAIPAAQAQNGWGEVQKPSQGPTRVYGATNAGCIAGAQALPLDGPGYQVVRVSRNRYYGHPNLIAFVRGLAEQARANGMNPLYIGDLGQPRGGPMAFGHASHQSGLDVDVWFNLKPKPKRAPSEREDIEIISMVARDERSVDRANWTPQHVALLRLAAVNPRVERVLVNFAIKRELCRSVAGDRTWLRKVRPWYGHDEHFHVRIACPAGSAGCVAQSPVPPGDGCDESLDWWFMNREQQKRVETPTPVVFAPPRPRLPAQCRQVLQARSAR